MSKNSKKRKRPEKSTLPSAEELSDLKETQDLYKSNLFKLQLNELLKEVVVDKSETKTAQELLPLEKFLHKLKSTLDNLPSSEVEVSDTTRLNLDKKTKLPTHNKKDGSTILLKIKKPDRVDLVGSYLLGTVTRPILNLDITVQIPKASFLEKDYLDHRYTRKRIAYLQAIVNHLQSTPEFSALEISYFRGDTYKPILILRLPSSLIGKGSELISNFEIRIYPCISPETFAARKLAPNRCSIRNKDLQQRKGSTDEKSTNERKGSPTPLYNQRILEDMYFGVHLHQLHKMTSDCRPFQQAINLFKVWFRQHGLAKTEIDLSEDQCWNGFQFSMLLLYLLQLKKITKHNSCYQMFRAGLIFLAQSDFLKTGISLQEDLSSANESLLLYKKVFDVVFLDTSGFLNLTSRVTASAMEALIHRARSSLASLDDTVRDGFDNIFMKKSTWMDHYDIVVSCLIPLPSPENKKRAAIYTKYPTITEEVALRLRLQRLLKRGFTDRAKLIHVTIAPVPREDFFQEKFKSARRKYYKQQRKDGKEYKPDQEFNGEIPGYVFFKIGILLDSRHAFRLLDIGPTAENKVEVNRFRAFWMEKSEYKRFKDGVIAEAVAWPSSLDQRHTVPLQICKHIITRHLDTADDEIWFASEQLDILLQLRNPETPKLFGEAISSVGLAQRAFLDFEEKVKSLTEIPMTIVTVLPNHPVIWSGSTFPPQPIKDLLDIKKDVQGSAEYIPVILQFAHSSSWPDDLAAIARIKSAFYIKIGLSMEERYNTPVVVGQNFVDILCNGFCFRLKIYHEREFLLAQTFERENTPLPALPGVGVTDYGQLQRELVNGPWLCGVLKGIDNRHPLFGPTVRLAKRWTSAHMFDGHLPEEAVELLVAYLFVCSRPLDPPASYLIGFLRFLRLLAQHPWSESPLIIDVTEDMTIEQYNTITSTFEEGRRNKTAPLMYLATFKDPGSLQWTQNAPVKAILEKLITYAKSSEQYLTKLIESGGWSPTILWKTVFKTPLEGFNVWITLQEDVFPFYLSRQSIYRKSKKAIKDRMTTEEVTEREKVHEAEKKIRHKHPYKLPPSKEELSGHQKKEERKKLVAPLIGFNPVELYIRDLKTTFGSLAHFFYDSFGGTVITVSWKTDMSVSQKFTASKSAYTVPTEVDERQGKIKSFQFNLSEILADMRRLGDGLVQNIHTSYNTFEKEYYRR